jgi:predicted secreted hydrolase
MRAQGPKQDDGSKQDFTHDVFLSHSSKDKAVVRAVAERKLVSARYADCGRGGAAAPPILKVWLDDWGIRPQKSIRTSGWAGTCGRGNLPIHKPLNQERCFIQLTFAARITK